MRGPILAVLLLAACATLSMSARGDDPQLLPLEYTPAPPDNPLKGLVPYAADVRDDFPHSLEFGYLPLSDLVVGPGRYDWGPLEELLKPINGRGHQAVFRIYLEYPDRPGAIPGYLIEGGLKVHRWRNTNTAPLPPAAEETPDYEDPALRACLRDFVAALGARYDGDPRIGFITAGLLGSWGEWHTYPRNDLFASKSVQAEVMDAYEAAFDETPILLRYPAGPEDFAHASNADRPFGYHDDSFAWATLDTGRDEDDWFYMPALEAAGSSALAKWKTQPIGGEIRPEAWGRVFDDNPGVPEIQDFRRCVEATHATWLMDSGMFQERPDPARRTRAERAVRRLGYEYHVPEAGVAVDDDGRLAVAFAIENRGVAPFYRDWPMELGLLDEAGELAFTIPVPDSIAGILPGEPPRRWDFHADLTGLPAGDYRVILRVPNPMTNGKPLRFANAEQDRDREGWLTLGSIDRGLRGSW